MTFTRKLVVLGAVAALLTATLVVAQSANAGVFGEQVSGNFSDTAVDTDGDGGAANLFSGATKGNGSATYEGIIEIKVFDPPVSCPSGAPGVAGTVVAYSMVRRYANGDLLVSKLVPGGDNSLCFNPGTGLATLEIDATFDGGSGKHAKASGSYHATYDVRLLLRDPAGGIAHGTFVGSTTGTLN